MKCNSVREVRVEGGGGGVVAHVGLHALGLFADRLGVGASLSSAVPPAGERAPGHDRGKVLTQAMLMLAGGEDHIAALKTSGLTRLPFRDFIDSAGCSVRIAEACRDRNVGFSLVARRNDAIDAEQRTAMLGLRVLGAHPRRVVPTTRLRRRHPRQSRRQTPPRRHTPGRLTRSGRRTTIRLPTNHPGAAHLARIYNHIAGPPTGTKHHNRHHEPPGGPTTRPPSMNNQG